MFGSKLVTVPVVLFNEARYFLAVAPLSCVKAPPAKMVVPFMAIELTVLFALGSQACRAAFVLTAARLFLVLPFTVLKEPPAYKIFDASKASVFTVPCDPLSCTIGSKAASAPVLALTAPRLVLVCPPRRGGDY